jgi:hypothetical protein
VGGAPFRLGEAVHPLCLVCGFGMTCSHGLMPALFARFRPRHFQPNSLLVRRDQNCDLSGLTGSVQADPSDRRDRGVSSEPGRLSEGVHAGQREAA